MTLFCIGYLSRFNILSLGHWTFKNKNVIYKGSILFFLTLSLFELLIYKVLRKLQILIILTLFDLKIDIFLIVFIIH